MKAALILRAGRGEVGARGGPTFEAALAPGERPIVSPQVDGEGEGAGQLSLAAVREAGERGFEESGIPIVTTRLESGENRAQAGLDLRLQNGHENIEKAINETG